MVYGRYIELVFMGFINQRSHHWGGHHHYGLFSISIDAPWSPSGHTRESLEFLHFAHPRLGFEGLVCQIWWTRKNAQKKTVCFSPLFAHKNPCKTYAKHGDTYWFTYPKNRSRMGSLSMKHGGYSRILPSFCRHNDPHWAWHNLYCNTSLRRPPTIVFLGLHPWKL